MPRYRSLRRSRRKVPTICPPQRDNRKRARVCGSDTGSCEPIPVNGTAEAGVSPLEIARYDGGSWPTTVDGVTAILNSITPLTVISATSLGDDTLLIDFTPTASGGDNIIVTVPAINGSCPFSLRILVAA